MCIEDLIPHGRRNAIKRDELASAFGLSDRKMRREIQAARSRGVPIMNFQDGTGYYISDNVAEIKAFQKLLASRVRKHLAVINGLDNLLAELERKEAFQDDIG